MLQSSLALTFYGLDRVSRSNKIFQLFLQNPKKNQNYCGFAPPSQQIGLVVGQFLGILDRTSDLDVHEPLVKLTQCFLRAGYGKFTLLPALAQITVKKHSAKAHF